MNEVRESQQDINTTTGSSGIDNGVILEIRNTRVTPPTESQSNVTEANVSVNTPRNYSLEDRVISEIRNSSASPSLQDSNGSVEEQTETNVTSLSGNCNNDDEVVLNIGPSSVRTSS